MVCSAPEHFPCSQESQTASNTVSKTSSKEKFSRDRDTRFTCFTSKLTVSFTKSGTLTLSQNATSYIPLFFQIIHLFSNFVFLRFPIILEI